MTARFVTAKCRNARDTLIRRFKTICKDFALVGPDKNLRGTRIVQLNERDQNGNDQEDQNTRGTES